MQPGDLDCSYNSGRFVLQWHVTERCNLRCAHCYQSDDRPEEMCLGELLEVVEQFRVLLARLRQKPALERMRGRINITGGEPFVRTDFLDLLEVLSSYRDEFSFAILTNGTFIDPGMARQLSQMAPRFVQVSMEGSPNTNDAIRGREATRRTISALQHLLAAGVPASISFTAHQGNAGEFGEVADLGRELGVSKVWADRIIPFGSGSSFREQQLSPEETRELFETMFKARERALGTFCRTDISMGRALQFLVGGGEPYRCAAGETLVTVLPNGDLLPCRRLPIVVGNVFDTPLVELYHESELFQSLRGHRVSEGCEECRFALQCRGGLRCLSYAVKGDPFAPDPGCWLCTERAECTNGS